MKNDPWKSPEVIKLYQEIEDLQQVIDKRVKENRRNYEYCNR